MIYSVMEKPNGNGMNGKNHLLVGMENISHPVNGVE